MVHCAFLTDCFTRSNYLLTHLLTYLLTPWSRVLLEKLTGSAASQEISRIFGLTYLLDYLLTYLLTPWSRVLLEKLTGSAASQEIPRIFRTRRFITVLTSARHLSLSSANSIQSPQPPPTS